jgi:hydroxymethylglutaryl-CoA lyase
MGGAKGVIIREVATRDGFQSWPEFVPTEDKLRVIRALMESGVREIETTSFVNPKAIPQMRDAAELMARVPREGCRHTVLVPNLKGADLALGARPDEIGVFISASEPHNMANVRRSVGDSLADLQGIFALARQGGVPVTGAVATAFGCPFQGDVSEAEVMRVAEAYVSLGANLVILADTTGMATPNRVARLVRAFMGRFPEQEVGIHLHNNRGTAMVNLMAALEQGVRTFDTALGGIGGCPNVPQAAGNLPTEDVVYLLEEMGVPTGIDLVRLIRAAHLLERILGRPLPGQVMKSGPRDPALAAQVCGISHTI